jgi:hypothetical protein
VVCIKPSKVNQGLDKGGIALISQRSSDHSMRFRDLVKLAKGDRIAVWIGNEVISVRDMVGFCDGHQILGWDFDDLTILEENSRIALGKERTTRRPGELEYEWVVGAFGCW